jgi:hypothetical protein
MSRSRDGRAAALPDLYNWRQIFRARPVGPLATLIKPIAQEAGTHQDFLYQQNSLRDAVVAALNLEICQRHTDWVKMANIGQMINVLQAMILADKDKMLLTPTYHIFDTYRPYMDATPCPVKVSGPQYRRGANSIPMIDMTAVRDRNNKVVLAIVNSDPDRPANMTTNLTGTHMGASSPDRRWTPTTRLMRPTLFIRWGSSPSVKAARSPWKYRQSRC